MLKNITLLSVSALISCLLAEIATRLLYPEWAPGTPRLAQFWQYDERYGWSHAPGTSGKFESFGFSVGVSINSSGFRGPEIAPRNPAKTRILAIGDSFVWGFGVEQADMFSTRLQELCRNTEVINLGVSGYSTDQELLVLQEFGSTLDPDIVLLMVADNDYKSNTRDVEYVYYHKPVYQLEGDELRLTNQPVPKANPLIRFAAATARQSYILTQIGRTQQSVGNMAQQDASASASAPEPAPVSEPVATPASPTVVDFPRNPAEAVTTRLVQEFINTARAASVGVVVTFMDPRGNMLADKLEIDAGVTVLQLHDVLDRQRTPQHYLPQDMHWNAAGHQIVATLLAQRLVHAGMLPADQCEAAVAR